MKTQIIQLDIHDDTLSVRDKMDWSQTPRVLLVWPASGKVLRQRLDLILLERYCSSHGSQLALLTKDPEVIFKAEAAGIPIFQSRQDAQLQPWGKSFREFQRQDLQRKILETPPPDSLRKDPLPEKRNLPLWARIPIFTLGVLSVMAIAATLFPTADIKIRSDRISQEFIIPFQAEPDVQEIGLAGTVPGRKLEVVVEGQLSRSATGETSIPTEYASGEVTFRNLGDQPILIPKDTILSTSGENPVLFRTIEEGQTPPGAGEEVTIGIEALHPGETGNVSSDSIREINLSAGAELSVTNPQATTGGADLLIPAPNQRDRDRLSFELNKILEDDALDQIKSILTDDDVLLSTRLNEYEILEENYSPEPGDPGDTLWLDRRIRFLVYYAAAEDLKALARELVQAQYQEGALQPDLDSIQFQTLSMPVLQQDGSYHWQEQISWEEISAVDPDQVISWSIGKNPSQAASVIQENLDLERTPDITLNPGWWPRIPVLPFRIRINPDGMNDG